MNISRGALRAGASFSARSRPRCQARALPPAAPPNMTARVKDAVGRALMHGIARVERHLARRRLPPADVEDFALECAALTYRNIVNGTVEIPADVADYL